MNKKAQLKVLAITSILIIFSLVLVFALSGSGTIANPYEIHSWTELNEIRNNLSASYILVANLSSTDSDYSTFNSGSGWNPIGNDTNPFTGTFNGNGNTISYLQISRAFTYYIGLFGYVNSASRIYDVSLVQTNVVGYYAVGGLVGYNNNGTIENSYSTGTVAGTVDIGGLVGVNLGTINNTYSTANVSNGYYIAGLVGYNDGTIENSYSTGNVTGESGSIKGFVGSHGSSSVISNSYYNSQTSRQSDTGYGEPRNTTQMTSNPYDTNTYLSWDFTNRWLSNTNIVYDSEGNVGYPALIFQSVIDTIVPFYSNAKTNNTKVSFPTLFSIDVIDNIPLNPNGMYIFSTNNSGVWVNDTIINFTSITQTISVTKVLNATPKNIGYKWYINDSSGNKATYSSQIISFSIQGSGTEEDPYLVTTWADLDNIRNNLGKYYKLANNLSSSDSDYLTYNSGQGFRPIGNFITPFTGVLDGDKNIISDLYMNNNTNYVGLFAWGVGGTVVNIGFINANISGLSTVGIIFAKGGTVLNSYATGKINGTNYIGGLIGNTGTIKNSYVNVNVNGSTYIGGLIGGGAYYIYNSYSKGNVTGDDSVGGIIGLVTGGTFINVYSNSNVSGNTGVGGALGNYFPTAPVAISVFWDNQTSGQTTSYGGNGKTTSQMKNISTFQLPSRTLNISNGGFEYGNLTDWNTGGNANWIINDTVYQGLYSARAGTIPHNNLTWINRSITLASDKYLNFYWKAISENSYDLLIFCLNNSSCTRTSGYTDYIDNNDGYFRLKNYNLSAGTYVLHWAYAKDSSGSTGMDTGWIDDIFFTDEIREGLEENWDFSNIWNINAGINNGYPYLDYRGINVSLVSPTNDSSSSTFNQSFNCSVTSLYNLKNVTFSIWNSDGTLLFSNKTTVDLTLNYSIFNYTFANDGDYDWNCEFTDTEYNRDSQLTNNTVHISTISPAINLYSPSNNKYLNYKNNVNFNFSAVDADGLSVCEVWGNFTGVWEKNYTYTTPTNGLEYSRVLNLTDGRYIWNTFCNDTYNNGNFFHHNYTTTIDTTFPIPVINSITTTAGSQTISYNSTASDINLDPTKCKYSIYNSTGSIDGLNNNVSIVCNSNPHSATVTGYANYTLRIYERDLALNENYTDLNFTTSASVGVIIIGGGGGGGVTKEIATNFSITSTNLLDTMDNALAKDSKKARTKEFLIINKGIDPITVTISCDTEGTNKSTRNISICDYVTFSATTFEVPPNEQERIIGYVNVLTPEDSEFGDIYYFNILAVSKEGNTEKYSKLSVSNHVNFLDLVYKWSYLPQFGEGEKHVYPVSALAFFVGLLFSILIFIVTSKADMPLTGFLLGTSIFIILFLLVLVVL